MATSRSTSRGREVRSRVTPTAHQPFVPWSLLRRPGGAANQMRWFLGATTLVSLLSTFPAALALSSPTARSLLLPATLALIACWGHRYHRRSVPAWLDACEAIATGVFLAASPIPDMAFAFLFMAIWLRAMCGTTRPFIRYVALIVMALPSGMALWPRIPGHHGPPDWRVLLIVPLVVLVSIAGRYLALSQFAREQAQRRDVVLIRLGVQLLAADSRSRIAAIGLSAATKICAETPGLTAGMLVDAEAGLTVVRQVGCKYPLPPRLLRPVTAAPDHDGDLASVGRRGTDVTTAVGLDGSWRRLPIPGQPGQWILIGSSGRLSQEAVGAFASLINQVGLALRNVAALETLTAEASTDGLTGLLNRAAFERRVLSALTTGAPTAILYVDLDGFKAINDDLGHPAGDEVLQHIAKRLRHNVRPRDICARLGGDEFAVLLPATELAVAQDVARRLALLSAPMTISGHTVDIGASIGVAHGGSDAAELIRAADQAMYAAKRARREDIGPAQVARASGWPG